VGDVRQIVELRRAIAGAAPAEVRRLIENRLPLAGVPATGPEFDAWTWTLYDLGLAAETIPDPRLAIDLYARSIECNRTAEHLKSAALVRSGLCLEQLGRWMEAKRSYQEAEPGSFDWPENRALLLWRLGCLQSAAEEYEPALSSFGQLFELLPQPGIPRPLLVLEWAACLEHANRIEEAMNALTGLSHDPCPAAVDALLRLTSLHLRSGRPDLAAEGLARIAVHPMAEPGARAAAVLRLAGLESKAKCSKE